MGVKVVWDNDENSVIRYIIAGEWTWGDVYSAIGVSDAWLDERDEKIHFIIDLRKSSEKAADKSLGNVRRLLTEAHPNTGHIIVAGVQQSPIIQLTKSILAMAQRISGQKLSFHFADTLEQARDIIDNQIDFA